MTSTYSTSRFSLKGNRVMLTGAAGGIGRAIALALAEAGADLALVERPNVLPNTEFLEQLANLPVAVKWYYQELGNTSVLTSFVDQVWADGPLHGLVNNAGIAFLGRFNEVTSEQWHNVMTVNLEAPFLLSQRVGEHFIHEKIAGRIIMISSKNGIMAEAGLLPYNTAKAGLEMLGRSLAVELGSYGITVNSVCPGMVDTGLADVFELDWDRFLPYYKDHIPLEHRFAQPTEIAGAIVFLCSAAASYLTGQSLVIDGGVLTDQVPREAFMKPFKDRISQDSNLIANSNPDNFPKPN